MKNLLPALKVFAALLFLLILNDSVNSQHVISSVNVSENAAIIAKPLATNVSKTTILSKDAENWMSHQNYLDNNSVNLKFKMLSVLNELVIEPEKQIESWMLDDSKWILSDPVYESAIKLKEIESWMLDDEFWKLKSDYPEENKHVKYNSIEDWMIDDNFWVMVN